MAGEKKTCSALLIDVRARAVREVSYVGLAGLQALVGGSIEVAYHWLSGDVLYVDEAGLFKPDRSLFVFLPRTDQALAGNGVVVGRERDAAGNTAPPRISREALAALVLFDLA